MGRKSIWDGITLDGWVNVLTGLGTIKDKRTGGAPSIDLMTYDTLATLYRASDLAARIVELPANDMLREGFEARISDDEDATEELGGYLEEREAECALIEALKWKRAYGGAIILVGANDGSSDLSRPLNEEAIKSIDYLNVFDAFEARPDKWEENPLKKDYGKPTIYQINPHLFGGALKALQNVHASRCLVFQGPTVNRKQLRTAPSGVGQGWGDSVLVRCATLLRDYDQAWGGVSTLLQDFAQSVYAIKGLGAALLADKDKTIKKRFQLIEMARSIINATLIDADDEKWERKTTSIAGVPETLVQFQARMSAAAEIPVTKLFGVSAGGLNSNDDTGERGWYDLVRFKQKHEAKAQISRLVKLCMLAKDSPLKGKEPDEWTVHFHPLWQESNSEKAEIRNKNAQTDKIYHDLGVASTEDIGKSRWGGDEYGMDLTIDLDALEEREATAQELADVTHETVTTNLQKHGQETPPKPAPVPGKPGAKK